jgi:hypothetical protein
MEDGERLPPEALGEANHVWASQYRVTSRNVPHDNSSFRITFLRRGMGGKRKASAKSHLRLSALMASGASASFQEQNRCVCTDWRDANKSIWGGPHRVDIWRKILGARCQSGTNWNLKAASAYTFSSDGMKAGRRRI